MTVTPLPFLRSRLLRSVSALLGVLLVMTVSAAPARAEDYARLSGAGSTWSENAIRQWIAQAPDGLVVDYAGTGSSDGRAQFKVGSAAYGVSEIPYGLKDAFGGGSPEEPPSFPFAYMPIVAGGTAFMYNLTVNGQRFTNLRLNSSTVTKIFTGVITKWDDPAIVASNPGVALPARPIVPVVRSDGSGTTAQFSRYMSKVEPDLWNSFCAANGGSTPCGLTSQYPAPSGFVAQPLSLGVTNYTAQNEGAITYVEYSYALNAGYPVAKMLNSAGFYVLPTASNVAVALTYAKINADDLTQNLDDVYATGGQDPRVYPLSSYSYALVHTSAVGPFTASQGRTMAAFAQFFLCQGQQHVDALGFSPLPRNLVQAGFSVIDQIPGSTVQDPNLATCDNPTFSRDGTNTLAATAPQPDPCDQKDANCSGAPAPVAAADGSGSGADAGSGGADGAAGAGGAPAGGGAAAGGAGAGAVAGGGAGGATGGGSAGSGATAAAGSGGAGTAGGAAPGAGRGSTGSGAAAGAAGGKSAPVIDPNTGQVKGGSQAGGGAAAGTAVKPGTPTVRIGANGKPVLVTSQGSASGTGAVAGANGQQSGVAQQELSAASVAVTTPAGDAAGSRTLFMLVTALFLLAAIVSPPLLARRLRTRTGQR